jgi:uncharacterized protein YacL
MITQILLALTTVVALETTYLAYDSFKKQKRSRNTEIFVDTSVLIDGRILSLASTGFVLGTLVIPRSVISELQLLADRADGDKREKARRGLDNVKKLQEADTVEVLLLQDGAVGSEGVDERLLSLAKKRGGFVMTIDYNLVKVAHVEGITVLNINELAKELRMSYTPGDVINLNLTTTGSDAHQAVGHLGDGTMVVVEQAKKFIGKTVQVEVIRSLQTDAGRMLFAKVKGATEDKPKHSNQQKRTAPKQTRSQGKQASEKAQQPRQNKSPRNNSRRKNSEDTIIELANQ